MRLKYLELTWFKKPLQAPIKKMSGYVSPAMCSEGISSEVQRMLQEMQMEEKVATIKNIDQHQDEETDFMGNPVSQSTIMTIGKYKGRAFADIYREEKDYVKWVRTHVNSKGSQDMMKKLRIFVEFTDASKIRRVNQNTKETQGPIPPVNLSPAVRGKAKTRPLEPSDEDMDWETIPVTEKGQLIDMKWNEMTQKLWKKDLLDKQNMVIQMAKNPKTMKMMMEMFQN